MKKFQRIVAGVNEKQESVVYTKDIIDLENFQQLPNVLSVDNMPSAAALQLFFSTDSPQTINTVPNNADMRRTYNYPVPGNAFQLAMIQFLPTQPVFDKARKIDPTLNADHRKFALHRSQDNDYCVLISGKLIAIIGDDENNFVEHELNAGDIIILGDANHTWFNPGTETAYLLAAKLAIKQ